MMKDNMRYVASIAIPVVLFVAAIWTLADVLAGGNWMLQQLLVVVMCVVMALSVFGYYAIRGWE